MSIVMKNNISGPYIFKALKAEVGLRGAQDHWRFGLRVTFEKYDRYM